MNASITFFPSFIISSEIIDAKLASLHTKISEVFSMDQGTLGRRMINYSMTIMELRKYGKVPTSNEKERRVALVLSIVHMAFKEMC